MLFLCCRGSRFVLSFSIFPICLQAPWFQARSVHSFPRHTQIEQWAWAKWKLINHFLPGSCNVKGQAVTGLGPLRGADAACCPPPSIPTGSSSHGWYPMAHRLCRPEALWPAGARWFNLHGTEPRGSCGISRRALAQLCPSKVPKETLFLQY